MQKSAKKVENVNFDTLRRPFWIPPFFRGGTLVFELFSTFSSKMGSRGIKWPIYPEFMMTWNYAQKITPYSPPLLLSGEQCILSNAWKNLFKWDFFQTINDGLSMLIPIHSCSKSKTNWPISKKCSEAKYVDAAYNRGVRGHRQKNKEKQCEIG